MTHAEMINWFRFSFSIIGISSVNSTKNTKLHCSFCCFLLLENLYIGKSTSTYRVIYSWANIDTKNINIISFKDRKTNKYINYHIFWYYDTKMKCHCSNINSNEMNKCKRSQKYSIENIYSRKWPHDIH